MCGACPRPCPCLRIPAHNPQALSPSPQPSSFSVQTLTGTCPGGACDQGGACRAAARDRGQGGGEGGQVR
eukprot:scaffold140454_cov69-Phaeocystis_antarctica.AAC.1